jgi:tripartite-type tricarboxylate transporter receptor subunit TctC
MKKIAIGFIVLSAVVPLVLVASATAADKFPSKRITYKICFNPGGESDITARFQEAALKKALGVDVAITYQVGGGGALCWAELVKTNPDGYTIAGHNLPHTVLQPLEMGNAGYNTLDLKQIYFFESTPNVLLVRSDSPYKTLWRTLSRPPRSSRPEFSPSAAAEVRRRTTWGRRCSTRPPASN